MLSRFVLIALSLIMMTGYATVRYVDPLAFPTTLLDVSEIVTETDVDEEHLLQQQADNWGITIEDWQTYQERIQGLAGIWYPHLSPAEVLVLTETDPQKRNTYLDIAVEQIRLHVEQTLAYENDLKQRLYDKYPDEPVLRPFDIRPFSPLYKEPLAVRPNSRIVLFAALSSPANWGILPRLISMMYQHQSLYLDIYLLDAENYQVQIWARQHNIPVELVNQNRITLNHDDGALLQKTLGRQQDPPILLLTNGKDSHIITLDDL